MISQVGTPVEVLVQERLELKVSDIFRGSSQYLKRGANTTRICKVIFKRRLAKKMLEFQLLTEGHCQVFFREKYCLILAEDSPDSVSRKYINVSCRAKATPKSRQGSMRSLRTLASSRSASERRRA